MARILKKLRGYLDFYTSYNETHIGFLQEITGKSFYIIHMYLHFEHFSVEFREAHDYHFKS